MDPDQIEWIIEQIPNDYERYRELLQIEKNETNSLFKTIEEKLPAPNGIPPEKRGKRGGGTRRSGKKAQTQKQAQAQAQAQTQTQAQTQRKRKTKKNRKASPKKKQPST